MRLRSSRSTETSGFQQELRALRDQVLAAIDGAVLGDVEDGLELYGRLVRSVIDLREQYAVASGIAPPPTWFNEHGREAEWLESDLRAFVDRAWNVGNEDVLQAISVALTRFLRALRQAEQLSAHRRVLGLATKFVYRSIERTDGTAHRLGRSMLIAVRSYGEFQVLSEFRANPRAQAAYLEQVVAFLADAVHLAVDHRPDWAPGAVVELGELLDGIRLQTRDTMWADTYDERMALLDFASGYVIGLLGYVLMVRDRKLISSDDARAIVIQLQKTGGDTPAWVALRSALGDRRTSTFPWSHWEMQHWPEGVRGGTIGVLEDWIRVAAVVELNRRNQLRDARRALADLRPWDAAHMVKQLRESLRHLSATEGGPIVPGWPTEEQLPGVEDELVLAEREFERLEGLSRSELPIEADQVSEFVRAVESEWLTQHPLRWSLTHTESDVPAPTSWFGFNSLQPRDFFTQSPYVHAPPAQLGESIGRGLIEGEIVRIVEVLDELPRRASSLGQLKVLVDALIDELRAAEARPRILIVGEWRAAHALLGDFSFGAGTSGSYRDAPVDLEYVDRSPVCFVFDPDRTLLVRRWPAEPKDINDKVAASNRLLINVREIDHAYASELIENNPGLRSSTDGEAPSDESSIERLRQLVHIRVWTKLEIDLAASPAGYAIDLRVDDTP